ncbi:hypothetical protein ANO11243_079670 [Dothideomycetidae sp. 11243]|nr:hypothetical protein ANO11243_079670 [fungal sp. No.11243]
MWQNGVDESRMQRTESNSRNQWHNSQDPSAGNLHSVPSDSSSEDKENSPDKSGTWGEWDTGHLNEQSAAQDVAALQRELSRLSRRRSRGASTSRLSRRSTNRQRSQRGKSLDDIESPLDGSADAAEERKEADDDFALDDFIREGHFEKRTDGRSAKKVGVVFRNLTVLGVGASATFVKTLPQAILGTFGPDLYHLLVRFLPFLKVSKGQKRALINDISGVVRDGEMMLVLGRPGSGCTTFLKAIANDRSSYAGVSGEVSYGGIPANKQNSNYRGEVLWVDEDDIHLARLSVWQTLIFALANKTKKKSSDDIPVIANALMKMFGISHTKHTLVGDEYTRGISGGERKRVSIAETLASRATVVCWDNSTRGLDASTALDYAKSLRIMTDISNRTTLVTLYQAGEGIFELMDKVLVLDAGRCIYQGPAHEARQYFTELGFHAPERQTTADFLTAVTDPNERQFRAGCEASTPKTAEELEHAFRQSRIYQQNLQDVENYEAYLKDTSHADAKEFEGAVKESKSKTVAKKSSYTVSFPRQVLACTRREFWLLWGDMTTLYTKAFIIVANGLIIGSLFYGQSLGTSGAFTRGGSLFFSILFLGWLQLAELMKAVSGRAVVARHREYAFYRPSAVVIARVVSDFPILLVQTVVFGIIMYFMNSLDVDASKFWIYLLFVYISTICLISMYRMFAALSPTIDDAVRFSGLSLNILAIFTGYVIPKTQLLTDYIWFGWLYWISPVAYAFEGVLTNEFSNRNLTCDPADSVPQGPGIDPSFQGCTLAGAAVNAKYVNGEAYMETQYTYTRKNLWRNFAVVVAFSILYILITVLATELFNFAKSGGGALVFKRTKKAKAAVKADAVVDEESVAPNTAVTEAADEPEKDTLDSLSKSRSIFTWQDVEYTVPYGNGERKLLNKVSGYAKPGVMVALVGASGAGKTTLLNTLAQRQTTGVVSGSMLVDGNKLGIEFQRGTGFCEQSDLHDGTATIREALEFSAILRQDASTPRAEKIAYVDNIISLLELDSLQDAIISSLGVEQRKRLTIGVELAAKPQLLLFLDEPTSGLDSQSAWSIVRFLKKLSNAGQAIICTIHQPSSQLIQQFDMILALNPGGNTFYFGEMGENGSKVVKYFADRGVECPPNKNVAEFILETAAKRPRGPDGRRIDWNEEWKKSAEAEAVLNEIEGLKRTRSEATDAHKRRSHELEFAAPVWLQTAELTKRIYLQYWRDPSYLYGKLFVSVLIGIFNGFTFWKLGNSIQDMQNRMFTVFLIIVLPPTIVNSVVPKFYSNMALWMAREHPSRIYGWFAFTTAQILGEIPIAIVGGALYWALWYWPSGLPSNSESSGYVFLMSILFFLFISSWGQWICAFAPSFTVISNVLPFFFVMFALFNGVVRPYAAIPAFWRYWIYYVVPSTYWIAGVLAATLKGIEVRCAQNEVARFDVPAGQTCASYAGPFANSSGGYLLNPSATSACEYCPYSSADEYLATLNIKPDQMWRNFGIFLAFCISNWALVYFFIYTVRIKGWSFGFGWLFGTLGKGIGRVKGVFKGKRKASSEETEKA